MKKSMMTAVLASPLLFSPAFADENVPDAYGYIGGHASQYLFYDNEVTGDVDGLDDSTFLGGQLGWRFSPRWSVQAWYGENDQVEHKYTERESDLVNYHASLRHHFDETSLLGFEPYMGVNVGTQEINDNEETMSGVEMGIQRAFFKNVLLDLGTRHAYSSDREFWEGQVYAGVNLMFAVSGRESDSEPRTAVDEPAEVVSRDSDGDGVIDARDDCPGTAANAVVDDQGCQVYEVRREETVKTIYFEFDQSDIRDQFSDEVRSAAEQVREGGGSRIRVKGHTDSIGTEQYNQALSERRADSVRDQLIQEYQVESEVIEIQGYGERRPVATNETAAGRQQNRRAEIVVESEEKKAQFKE